MFGAFGKLIGAIVLIVGVLAMLAGPVLMTYGMQQQADNDQGFMGDDQEKTEENGTYVLAGAAASIAGVLVASIGLLIIGLSTAGRNATLLRRTREGQAKLTTAQTEVA